MMASPSSHSIVTLSATSTPPTSTPSSPDEPTPTRALDDIFSSSPDGDHPLDPDHREPAYESLSDLPAIRRQHVTAGYREGLAISKAKTIQPGFDAGYPLGVDLGMRVGRVLGILEAIISAMTKAKKDSDKVNTLLIRARRDLEVATFLEGVTDEALGRDMKMPDDAGKHGTASTTTEASTPIFSRTALQRLETWEKALEKLSYKTG